MSDKLVRKLIAEYARLNEEWTGFNGTSKRIEQELLADFSVGGITIDEIRDAIDWFRRHMR